MLLKSKLIYENVTRRDKKDAVTKCIPINTAKVQQLN